MKTKISDTSILKKLPMSITINDDPYIISETTNGIILFSAICPHQHNVVSELEEDCWRCPSHEWTFDSNSGCSINAPTESLTQFPVFIENEFGHMAGITKLKLYEGIKEDLFYLEATDFPILVTSSKLKEELVKENITGTKFIDIELYEEDTDFW